MKVSGIEATFSKSNDDLTSEKPIIVVNEDGDELFDSVKSETADKNAYFSNLGTAIYSRLCEALGTNTLIDAQIVGVVNIDATVSAKEAIQNASGSVSVTIPVNDIVSSDRVALVHYHNVDGGRNVEVIPATAGDGTITFELPDEFSPFVIVKLPVGSKKGYLPSNSTNNSSKTSSSSMTTSTATTSTAASDTTSTPSGYTVPNTAVK